MPKIALVDDDRNILTSVSLTLEAEGYNVSTYTDGASGLEGERVAPMVGWHDSCLLLPQVTPFEKHGLHGLREYLPEL